MELLTSHPAETAPKDGRVFRAWFWRDGRAGAEILAASWDREGRRWVDLSGTPVGGHLELRAWGPE